MYSNVAYIRRADDASLSLSVNCCGQEHTLTANTDTRRLQGRSDYLLLYTCAGRVHIVTDDKEQVFPAGTIVLYKPNQPQRYKFFSEEQSENFWVHFSGKDVEKILNDFDLNNRQFFFINNLDELNGLFLHLIEECQSSQPYYRQSGALILQNIFLYIARNSTHKKDGLTIPKTSGIQPQEIHTEITNAINYFNEHYAERININQYAKNMHMSQCWFIRMFKKYTNTTPMQYIMSVRISKAKSLLESSSLGISEIAAKVGYGDSMYFSRIFKQHTGISPLAYRKKNW